jgi:hypothetical protein
MSSLLRITFETESVPARNEQHHIVSIIQSGGDV